MTRALVASALLVLPLAACAESGHEDSPAGVSSGGHHEDSGDHGDHAGAIPEPVTLVGAWSALTAQRDAIAADVESGALADVHAKAEALPARVAALLEQSADLDAEKRRRVEGAAKQVTRVADALHVAADRGDATRTRKELSRLDGLLQLIRAQYPPGALDAGSHDHGDHSAAPAHAHGERPAGVVDEPAQATVRIQAFDGLRFEPKRIEVQAGIPTRIELENVGAAEHTLVVKTPDGAKDWVHLHVPPGASKAAVYQFDEPGSYPVLCTIPGHTEGGMTGELVVLAGTPAAHSH